MGITFPALDPVAFSIGSFPIRWYALAYMAGFLLGWRYALYLAGFDKKRRPTRDDVDDFIPWVIVGVILGGRLGYVLFYNLSSYLNDPLAALKIWEGGMSFHGGALGVVLALVMYPAFKNFKRLRLADIACAAVPIGLFFGRIANFINGELYGRVAYLPWAVQFPKGGPEPRHPSQLYEAVLEGAVLFIVLFFMMRSPWIRNRTGVVSGTFLAGYGVFRAFVEFFREPDAHIGYVYGWLSMGQILSFPMILAGLCFIIYGLYKPDLDS